MTENKFEIDFIGVGAPKSGSSWLSECIKEHPEAQMSYIKEVTFFNDVGGIYHKPNNNYQKGIKWYKSQFPKKKRKVIGEFSVDYLYDKKSAKRIKKHFPKIKILITLRKPIDKMYSYFWWYKNMDKAENANTFEEAIKTNKEFVNRSKYYQQLKRYFDQFTREKIKIVLHKDIKDNPEEVLTNVYSFLGIKKNFKPSILNKKINPARKTRSKKMAIILDVAKFMRESRLNALVVVLRKIKIYDLLHKLYINLNMEKRPYPKLKLNTRLQLVKVFQTDIRKTEKLTSLNLQDWLEV